MIHIRCMRGADLPLVMRLKHQAGWNQTEGDLRRFLDLEPEGCFVAERASEVVATTTTCTFETVAWIAMVLVDPAARGQGIGTALMRHALAFLEERGVRCVRLDATPLGRPIYERLGFVAQYELARFEGSPVMSENRSIQSSGSDLLDGLAAISPTQLEQLLDLDRSITGTPRRKLLLRLFDEQPEALRVLQTDGTVLGFLMARPGARAVQIGPCLARNGAGRVLFADAQRRYVGQPVFIDVPTENQAALALAGSMGLTVQRRLVRMCRGEPVKDRVEELWASSGPEKG